jgi:hypothetical protein
MQVLFCSVKKRLYLPYTYMQNIFCRTFCYFYSVKVAIKNHSFYSSLFFTNFRNISDVDLDMLVGQIVLLEINGIESILSFFATLKSHDPHSNIALACGYADKHKGRYADKILKFKEFFVNKQLLVKVIAVTDENK